MRELNMVEIANVSGGEIVCTIGTSGINCTGTATEWADAFFGTYDDAVSSFTDFFEWVDKQFSEEE